jgi:hypothetical protein
VLTARRVVAVVGVGLVALGVAWGLRYGLLEAGRLPADCSGSQAWECQFKNALVWAFLGNKLGWLALASGGLAFLSRNGALAWVGWVTGVLGVILYCFDSSALGGLAALLVLIRPAHPGTQAQQQAA